MGITQSDFDYTHTGPFLYSDSRRRLGSKYCNDVAKYIRHRMIKPYRIYQDLSRKAVVFIGGDDVRCVHPLITSLKLQIHKPLDTRRVFLLQ